MQINRRFFFLFFVLNAFVAFGALKVEVKRLPAGRANLVVHCPLSPVQAAEARGKALVMQESRKVIPYTLAEEDGKMVLSLLLPGIVREGDAHILQFQDGLPAEVPSDLTFSSDTKSVTVQNQHFALHHKSQEGGLPTEITFVASGRTDASLGWIDRLFSRDLGGQYYLANDRKAQARLVSSTPLRAVVEVNGSYLDSDGAPAPGNPKAMYRFIYSAFSPVVEVECTVTQEGDCIWPELDFLQLNTGNTLIYDRWLGRTVDGIYQKTLKSNELVDKENAISAKNGWMVMMNAKDAVGLSGQAVAYDAHKAYRYYVKSFALTQFKGKIASGSARLYLGAASNEPRWFDTCLGNDHQPIVHAYFSNEKPTTLTTRASQEFDFGELLLSFDDVATGYAVAGIRAKAGGPQFCVAAMPRPLWRLEFRNALNAATGFQRSPLDVPMENTALRREGNTVTLTWKDVPVDATGNADVTARATVTGTRIEWTLEVENHSTANGLWESEFPILSEIFPAGQGDLLVPSVNLGGMLYRNNSLNHFLSPYPGSGAPVQMMAFLRDGYGLYFAAHDGDAYVKKIRVTAEQDAYFSFPAENGGLPGTGQPVKFAFATEVFKGDWWKAAKIYRAWAAKNATWLRNGLIRDNPSYPKGIQELCYWFHTWANAPQMRDRLSKCNQICPVKHGMHWYDWHEIAFDTHYPEYKPTKPGVPEVAAEAVARGQVVMPYINGHIWDRDIPSFATEGMKGAALDANGEPYLEIYKSKARQAPMCPVSEIWQQKMLEICSWLIDDVKVNAIYLDQIGAKTPNFCYNPAHGHPLGGGCHWVKGYRKLLGAINDYAKSKGKPIFLTTENTSDPYMDNVHGFLSWTERLPGSVPLLPAIYSGYTYYFSTPATPQDSLLSFRMSQGHDFLTGIQLGWNTDFLMREKYAEYFAYQMELAKLRAVTLDYMSLGELMGDLRPRNLLPEVTDVWHWAVNKGAKPREVTLPAVEGTYWQNAAGDFCLYLVNYSDQVQPFEFDLPKRGTAQTLLTRVMPEGTAPLAIVPDGSLYRTTLHPREIAAIVLSPAEFPLPMKPSAQSEGALRETFDAFCFQQATGLTATAEPLVPLITGETPQATFHFTYTKELHTPLSITIGEQTYTVSANAQEFTVELPRGKNQECLEARISAEGISGSLALPLQFVAMEPFDAEVRLPKRVFAETPFACEIVVSNHTSKPRPLEVLLRLPEGWKIMEGNEWLKFPEVPAKGQTSRVVTLLASDVSETEAKVTALIVLKSAAQNVKVAPKRQTVRAFRAANLTIDGDLAEWQGHTPIHLGESLPVAVKYLTHSYKGDKDLAVDLWLAWDEKALYLAAHVQDDVHANPSRGADAWKGDAIQVALCTNGPPEDEEETKLLYEFAVGLDEQGPFVATWNNLGQFARLAKAAAQASDKTMDLEFAVPWKLLGLPAPKPKDRFGFSFVAADNDSPNTPVELLQGVDGYLEFTPGVFFGKDPASYATLLLEE